MFPIHRKILIMLCKSCYIANTCGRFIDFHCDNLKNILYKMKYIYVESQNFTEDPMKYHEKQ